MGWKSRTLALCLGAFFAVGVVSPSFANQKYWDFLINHAFIHAQNNSGLEPVPDP